MSETSENLLKAFHNLMVVKGECHSKVCDLHNVAEMTVTQINYLKIIDRNDNMTFSQLAEITKITKPSVSVLINKLVALACVYREPCTQDKRVTYIRLTEKGTNIARYEETSVKHLINRMVKSLNENDILELIRIFNKVE